MMRWAIVAGLSLLVLMPACRRDHAPDKPAAEAPGAFAALTNRGKAYLENREAENCVAAFTAALALRPDSALAMRNLARGHLINTDADSTQTAITLLQRALAVDAGSVATNYLLGLAHARLGQYGAAVPVLERAVARDPQTPALRYQLAFVYEVTDKNTMAAEQLAETVRLDPRHVSAQLRLANQARRGGDDATWKKHFDEWQRLRQLLGQPDEELLWRCRYTEAETAPAEKPDEAPRKFPAVDVKFVEWPGAFASEADAQAAVACVLDVDGDGRPTSFVAEVGGGAALLTMSDKGVFVRTPVQVDAPIVELAHQCLAGNFRDEPPTEGKYDPKTHAMNDVLLVGPKGVSLLQRTGPTAFRNVTAAAGLAEVQALRAVWVDYEHDGDLDIAFADRDGFTLWRNNGDGSFEEVTGSVGLSDRAKGHDVFAIDMDHDIAIDLWTDRDGIPELYRNQRGGLFRLVNSPVEIRANQADNVRVLVADVDGDSILEGVFAARDGVYLARPGGARNLLPLEPGAPPALSLCLLDVDNDGRLEAAADFTVLREPTTPGRLRLLQLAGEGGDVSRDVNLEAITLPPIRAILPGDFDADGDTDLMVVCAHQATDHRLHLFRNDGGNANRQLKVRLLGTKTNTTGIGTRIEVRAGDFFVAHDVTGLPIEIGVGPRTKLDSIQTVWSNGVVDNRIDVNIADGKPVFIEEKNVATGSCPFLYVWDGEGFRFVTDLLGNAPVGLPLSREVLLDADPTEYVEIGPAAALPTKDGAYVAQVTSEFYEVLYFDEAKLVAVDHAPGVEVHSTDKLRPGPFPPSELVPLANRRPLVAAVGDDGVDRTADLAELDGRFAPCGAPQVVPYRGQTLPLAITIDFGTLDASAPLVLALTGWLQYGQASANIAMSQNRGLTVIPPRLEVEAADGEWQDVDVVVGMPSGKTKTILVDLAGKLPDGARRLRLTTTFEIRWDRAALLDRLPEAERIVHHLAPRSATLRFRGFSEISFRKPGHPTTPDPKTIFPAPPWRRTLEGWCTRYGDVIELLAERDGKMVIVNGGDCVDLAFDAGSLPPVVTGLTRTLFFYSVGWDKDGDHNVVHGDTVEPLPGEHPPLTDGEKLNVDDWRIRYNTRWVPRDFFQRSAGVSE